MRKIRNFEQLLASFFILSLIAAFIPTIDLLAAENLPVPKATLEQIQAWREHSAAHIIRLSETVSSLLQNEAFLNANPEYRQLAAVRSDAVLATLQHDSEKLTLSAKSPIVQTIAHHFGDDYRSMAPDSLEKKNLVYQIDQLNKHGDPLWQKSVSQHLKTPFLQQLLTDLVTICDFHDVAQARKFEFGGGKNGPGQRLIVGASQWIDPKSGGVKFSLEQIKRMLPISKFLETSFDYEPIMKRTTAATVRALGFETLAKGVANEAAHSANKVAKINSAVMRAGSNLRNGEALATIRRTPLTAALMLAPEYLLHPDDFSIGPLVESLAMTSNSLSHCTTSGCAEFQENCRVLGLDEEECVKRSIKNLPLEQQDTLRNSPDINQIFNQYSPAIVDLTCEKIDGSTFYKVETFSKETNSIFHVLEVDKRRRLQKVFFKGKEQPGTVPARLNYSRNAPDFLQIPIQTGEESSSSSVGFESFELSESLDKRIYPHQRLFQGERYQYIRFGRITRTLVDLSRRQIERCCARESCLDHFARRKKATDEVLAKRRQEISKGTH